LPNKTETSNELLKAMNSAALAACEEGRLDAARAQLVEIRERAREIDHRDLVAFATINLGRVARRAGDFTAALDYSSNAAELFGELRDDGGVMMAFHSCGWDSLALDAPGNARAQFGEALTLAARLGWRRGIASIGAGLAASLVALREEEERAAQLAGAASTLSKNWALGSTTSFRKTFTSGRSQTRSRRSRTRRSPQPGPSARR
jgi:Tetratricopeptide repeat